MRITTGTLLASHHLQLSRKLKASSPAMTAQSANITPAVSKPSAMATDMIDTDMCRRFRSHFRLASTVTASNAIWHTRGSAIALASQMTNP